MQHARRSWYLHVGCFCVVSCFGPPSVPPMEGAVPPAAGAGIGPAQPSTEGFHEGCIFMDYNGTTPVDKDVARAAHDAMLQAWGNPSSSHEYGQSARAALEQARAQVASLFNLGPPSVTFTSGGTEASNWAILGTIRRCAAALAPHLPHVITTASACASHLPRAPTASQCDRPAHHS